MCCYYAVLYRDAVLCRGYVCTLHLAFHLAGLRRASHHPRAPAVTAFGTTLPGIDPAAPAETHHLPRGSRRGGHTVPPGGQRGARRSTASIAAPPSHTEHPQTIVQSTTTAERRRRATMMHQLELEAERDGPGDAAGGRSRAESSRTTDRRGSLMLVATDRVHSVTQLEDYQAELEKR